jgi:hypothetical protein
MFYCFPDNEKISKLLKTNAINYVILKTDDKTFIRLNMGQRTEIIDEMLERLGV